MFRRSSAVLAFFAACPAYAQWSGELAVGYLGTSGNTRTQSLNGKLAADYVASSWKNSFEAVSVYTTDRGATSAERYAASDKVDWTVTERDYVFAAVDWETDLYGGVRWRVSETVGYGRHVLTGPVQSLDLEIGAGARQTEENVTRDRDDDVIFRGHGKYVLKLSDTSQFAQSLKVESGESNTFSESVTELKLSIIGDLFASLSYTVKHNSQVPEGTEETDTFTAANLSYTFGES